MWKPLRALVCLGAALLLTAGGARAAIDAASAEQIARESGMWDLLATAQVQWRAGFAAPARGDVPVKIEPAVIKRLLPAYDASFTVDRLRSAYVARFAQDFDARYLLSLELWHASDLAKRIRVLDAEYAALGLDVLAAATQGVAVLEQSSTVRRQLLGILVAQTGAGELTLNMFIGGRSAFAQAAQAGPPNGARAATGLSNWIRDNRSKMRGLAADLSHAVFAQSYQKLTDQELAAYVDFTNSAAGRHSVQVSENAFNFAFTQASSDLGRLVVKLKQDEDRLAPAKP